MSNTMKTPERKFRHQRCAAQPDGAGDAASIAKPDRACSSVAEIDDTGSEERA